MTDKLIVDRRKTDQRRYIYQPYWISSGEIDSADLSAAEADCALMFSFPAVKYLTSKILIEKCCIQVTELWAGGTITLDVGSWTIATDNLGTGDTITLVDQDEYIPTANITSGTAGHYFAATGDWITAKLLMTELTPVIITPADTTVPCIGLYATTDDVYTSGKARLHFLITEIPLV